MSAPVTVPPLTVRQWTKVEARLSDVALRLRQLGKPDRADRLDAAAKHVGSVKAAPKLVAIPFPDDAMASDVLEVIAMAGLAGASPEPAAAPVADA